MLVICVITTVFAQFIIDVEHMNFGNYYFALTNSLWAIRQCKLLCVVTQSKPNIIFQPGFSVNNSGTIVNLQTISGAFHYNLISNYIPSTQPTLLQRIDVMCPYVNTIRSNLPPLDTSLDKFCDDNTLIAHIRAGDIFATLIHPQYWQPPLGYYQFAAKSFAKIVVCAENKANPVVAALHQFCVQTRGHSNCLLRVGQPLTSDIAFLTRAKNLAIGYGTFGVVICALTNGLKRVYFPVSTMSKDVVRRLDFGSQTSSKRCVNSSQPASIAIAYNTTQVTRDEYWKANTEQLASLLIDQSRLQGLHEIQVDKH